jgi:small subunit ribosomal protein S17
MAETEENVNEEQKPEETVEETVAEETPAEEAPAEEAPAEEPAAEEAPAAEAAEPEEQLSPKERRRRSRSVHSGEAAPARTIEERAAARAEARRVKARHRTAYRARLRERRKEAPAPAPAVVDEPKESLAAKVRQGIVVSDKADKTITVRVDMARQHRRYGKIVRTSSTLHAHDESNDAHIGDTVRLVESRPLSRTKRWRLLEVLERAR